MELFKKAVKPIVFIIVGIVIGLFVASHIFINPENVVDYVVTDNGILLHTDDNGYYIEAKEGL